MCIRDSLHGQRRQRFQRPQRKAFANAGDAHGDPQAAAAGPGPDHDRGIVEPQDVYKRQGIGFHEYLTRFRVEEARQLLTATQYPIHEIAVPVGYADQSSFTKAFKRCLLYTSRCV